MKILIFYTEIASYTLSCLQYLRASTEVTDIHLVRYPVNSEAPFDFEATQGIKTYSIKDFNRNSLLLLAKDISPDILLVSGWGNKDYLSVAKFFRKKIPVVLNMDNHYTGSLKQRILCLVAPFFLKSIFSTVWVPGMPQKMYAQKLGFKEKQIKTGFYSADVAYFNSIYGSQKKLIFPKRFLTVARYIPAKNLEMLWTAFVQLQSEEGYADWELWCAGAGKDFDKRINHPAIKHLGFVQPGDMETVIQETSFFILPSKFEPWAVAVHEMAAAGFPLLLSRQVGAATTFLQHRENGFIFDAFDLESLKSAMKAAMELSQDEFKKMAKKSNAIAQSISPATWSDTVIKIISDFKNNN